MGVWYRALYTAVSAATAVFAFAFIRHIPDQQLWAAPAWLRWPMHGMQIAGVVLGVRTFEHLDGGEFLGFKQVWRYIARREVAGNIEGLTQKELVTAGVYGIVRHPLYIAGIIFFTFNPRFTVNSLIFAALADAYFIFGMIIEERRFERIFGDRYREYMHKVPMFIPRQWKR